MNPSLPHYESYYTVDRSCIALRCSWPASQESGLPFQFGFRGMVHVLGQQSLLARPDTMGLLAPFNPQYHKIIIIIINIIVIIIIVTIVIIIFVITMLN